MSHKKPYSKKEVEEYVNFLNSNEEKNLMLWKGEVFKEKIKHSGETLSACGHPKRFIHSNLEKLCLFCNQISVIAGVNDIFSSKSWMAKFWDYERNSKIGIFPHSTNEKISSKKVYLFHHTKILYSSRLASPSVFFARGDLSESWSKDDLFDCWEKPIVKISDLARSQNIHPESNEEILYCEFFARNRDKNLKIWKEYKQTLLSDIEISNNIFEKRADIIAYWDWEKNNSAGICPSQFNEPIGKSAFFYPLNHRKNWKESLKIALREILKLDRRDFVVNFRGYSKPILLKDIPRAEINYFEEDNCGKLKNSLFFSSENYIWRCNICNGKFEKKLVHYVTGRNCPYCFGNSLLKGGNDLASIFPEVKKIWDYDKNEKGPENYTSKSHSVAHWLCSKGHSYSQEISSKTQGGLDKCKICSPQMAYRGINDLLTKCPDVPKVWMKKNKICPSDIAFGSKQKFWVKCKNGHETKRAARSIYLNFLGCEQCSISQSQAETEIFTSILEKFPELSVVQQKSLGGFRPDICIENKKIVIEYNGIYWHMDKRFYSASDINSKSQKTAKEIWDRDDAKIKKYKELGYSTITVNEFDYQNNKEEVLRSLFEEIEGK